MTPNINKLIENGAEQDGKTFKTLERFLYEQGAQAEHYLRQYQALHYTNKSEKEERMAKVIEVLSSALLSIAGQYLHTYGVENETAEIALHQAEKIAEGTL